MEYYLKKMYLKDFVGMVNLVQKFLNRLYANQNHADVILRKQVLSDQICFIYFVKYSYGCILNLAHKREKRKRNEKRENLSNILHPTSQSVNNTYL